MKKYLIPFLLVVSCGTTHPIPIPTPVPPPNVVVWDTTHKCCITVVDSVKKDTTIYNTVVVQDTFHRPPAMVPVGLSDYAPYFQHQIDSCIAWQIPELDLPAGRFPMKEPLILYHWTNNAYVFFTLKLIGAGTAGESDGSGTILDWTLSPHVGFGIGVQDCKGCIVSGIKIWGAFVPPPLTTEQFYSISYSDYTDGFCRDSWSSPYVGFVVDPFGNAVPSDGGFPGTDANGIPLSTYYRASYRSGSTGVHLTECFLTGWVGDIITSPNGWTQNADNLTFDFLQLGNSKFGIAGCQDQEKNNNTSHIQEWGEMYVCFITNSYGAASVGGWNHSYWNIAGRTNRIVYNNQGGYFPIFIDHFYAESVGRIGFIASTNGTKISNSTINFATPNETGGHIITDQISGYGVTYDGCQLRNYGFACPVTIETGSGANDNHFINCSFENGVPFYPQTYPYGYSDFLNCWVGNQSSAYRLNPFGPSVPSIYAYPLTSNVAAKCIPIDNTTHSLKDVIIATDSTVTEGEPIVGTYDYVTYNIVGVVGSVIPGSGFELNYPPVGLDSTKQYSLYHWETIMK